ncbi:EH domain-containing protein 3-like [Oppia nitens]|uniref:EH domain-containing protein 3-like n=1 Tax=Oppia nitens TaxID=1686743 RepID=UPI0023DA2C2C|nr:EH domain-containing protein 3-like [Oppia nitens]
MDCCLPSATKMVGWLQQKTDSHQTSNQKSSPMKCDGNDGNVIDCLKHLYQTKVLPLEKHYHFDEFHSPPLESADFEAKPSILMVGQYSTGKTTFIKYILENEYPGIRIGPEPTTDRFISVMYNTVEGLIPGNALAIDANRQFRQLAKFGNPFLNRLQISETDCSVLKNLTFVDTPGILSGEKQRTDRGYDFTGVLQWFAERVDRIVLMFDANKLDISDEMKSAIEALRGHDDKMRIILNKADTVEPTQLMRVYGALMWSLAKVMRTPESVRVYIGTFWDQPLQHDYYRRLFETEEQDLLNDFKSLAKDSRLRILNDLIKRTQLVKVHALLMCELHRSMPIVTINKKTKQRELIQKLNTIYIEIRNRYHIPIGDFPDLQLMKAKLKSFDFSRLRAYKWSLFEQINEMMTKEVPKLMSMIIAEQMNLSDDVFKIVGGKFDLLNKSPFGYYKSEGIEAGSQDKQWIVDKDRQSYDKLFATLGPIDDKITSYKVKSQMIKSKLPNGVLNKIYRLADVDKDTLLDSDEFALAMYLMAMKLDGHDLPIQLPAHLIPPSKRPQKDVPVM